MNPTFYKRLQEVRELVEGNDLSLGTRRLVDFALDFDLPEELQSESVGFRARYNLEAGTFKDTENPTFLTLRLAMLKLLDDFVDHAPGEVGSEKPSPGFQQGEVEMEKEEEAEFLADTELEIVFSGQKIEKKYSSNKTGFHLKMDQIELKRGELTGVVGENGNGKTTLLRIIAGDLAASGGELHYSFLGNESPDWYRIKQEVAYIPQRLPRWFGRLKQNLKFAASIHGIKGKDNQRSAERIIHRLGLSAYEDATWGEISTGYKLRFELARALVWYPRLLVLDEPLANLDLNTRNLFLQDLQFLAKSLKHPLSIIISSQQLHEVEDVSDNIIFLDKGNPLYAGPTKDFGIARDENIFEITTTIAQGELRARLSKIDNASISFAGNVTVVRTPLDFSAHQFLQFLVNHDIPVSYFREISRSTRKLFRRHNA